MRQPHPNDVLPLALRRFFTEYLAQQRSFSPHTILSYRDSLKLLLIHVADTLRQRRASGSPLAAHAVGRVADLTMSDLTPARVLAFLDYVEQRRGNAPSTRNVRLAAIHSFFTYVAGVWPEHLELARRVLAIPFKRTSQRQVEYLEAEEVRAILDQIDLGSPRGRRDHALIALMFNTGARVHEIVGLKRGDVHLGPPGNVRLFGKGRKERICPIWPETARLIRRLLTDTGDTGDGTAASSMLFRNHHGGPLTRFGARLILQRHVRRAATRSPGLQRKRVHPHSLRHSTAVYLLRSGVDLSTIAHWLGHNSVNTTHKYTELDLQAKRDALNKAKPIAGARRRPHGAIKTC